MTLTRDTAEDIVDKALNGTPVGQTVLQLANMAGREMMSMRSWIWASEVPATADFTASQEYAELELDFLGFATPPRLVSSGFGAFEMVSLRTIEEYRGSNTTTTGTPYMGALTRATNLDNEVVPRLELWPTPATSETGALRYFYRRTWPGLGGDPEDAVRIPDFMENLYIEVLRAVARGWEDDLETPHVLQAFLATIKGGPIYQHAVETDRAAQPEYARVRGGVADAGAFGYLTFDGDGAPV